MLREPSHHCGLLLWRIYELKSADSAVHRIDSHNHSHPLQQHSFNVSPSFYGFVVASRSRSTRFSPTHTRSTFTKHLSFYSLSCSSYTRVYASTHANHNAFYTATNLVCCSLLLVVLSHSTSLANHTRIYTVVTLRLSISFGARPNLVTAEISVADSACKLATSCA